jgi:hypothetical protein
MAPVIVPRHVRSSRSGSARSRQPRAARTLHRTVVHPRSRPRGERAAAQKEIKGWLEKHLDDPAKAQLEARVKDLESNPAVRFRCGSAVP